VPDVLEVIADPTRRRILDAVRGEQAVGDIVASLQLSQPLVSKHLKVLRDAGLVDVRVDAQRRLYRVRPEPLRQLDAWLAPYRALWSTALDDLERHLDEQRLPED
jgi:DNA-binding transcriptional ArsR family regulator